MLLINLQIAYQNTTYSSDVQSQLKEIYQNLDSYFQKNQTTSARLSFVVQESIRAYKVNNSLNKYFESILLGTWGYVFEILFVYKLVCFYKFFI